MASQYLHPRSAKEKKENISQIKHVKEFHSCPRDNHIISKAETTTKTRSKSIQYTISTYKVLRNFGKHISGNYNQTMRENITPLK